MWNECCCRNDERARRRESRRWRANTKINCVSEIAAENQRSIQWQLIFGTITVPLGRYS
jgi:hypothetical protein